MRILLQLAKDGRHENLGDTIRIGVGCRTTVLKVAASLGGSLAGNTYRSTTVGHTIRELVDRARLVAASEALVIVLAVLLDAVKVEGLELLDGLFDKLEAALGTHLLGGEVGVQAGTIPVTLDGLGVEGHLDAKVFGHTGQEETRAPELITHW